MPRHKFEHVPFDEGRMHTHHAILEQLPYNPKVLIIGTFNPASENNVADFSMGEITSGAYSKISLMEMPFSMEDEMIMI